MMARRPVVAMNRIVAHLSTSAKFGRASLLCTASLLATGWTQAAVAQPAAPPPAASSADDEIIVTARKREESILKVPVVVTAVSDEQLSDFQITSVTDLPRLVPGLVIAGNLLSIGPQTTIRGVGTSSYDPGVDQSVSLNVDGLPLGQGLAFGSGMFDVQQVEVLKGPQALFFGKSSPGGVLSLRTADPTDRTEVIFRAGWEFVAREARAETIFSGPLSDTLGGRIAVSYATADGYFKNKAVPITSTGAAWPHSREPEPRQLLMRGTLLWNPTENFSARLKLNHAYDRSIDSELAQLANCPDGAGQAFGFGGFGVVLGLSPVDPIPFIGGDDCKFDRDIHVVYLDPAFFPGGITNGGVPYLMTKQNYGTLELNYDFSDITLTSVTAYYKLKSDSLVNPTHTTAAAPTFAVTNDFSRKQFTQELRLNSDFSGPFNFTLGGFYENGKLFDHVRFIRNSAYVFLSPPFVGADILNDSRSTTVDIETWSAFGQLRYRIMPELELSVGARWTHETRKESVFDFQNNVDLTPTLPVPKISDSNIIPEATINWTPTDDLTVFGSYKQGWKSGSYKVAVPPVAGEDNSFGDEKVKGYELGVKSRWFDRSLIVNLAFYDYYYRGLQVGSIEPAPGGVPIIRTVNAGKARSYGIDLDFAYRPRSIEGLNVNGAVNWNKAKYKELTAIGCYYNQTIAMGCNLNPDPFRLDPGTGLPRFTTQELSGTPMIRAPKWVVNFGFDYELPVGSGMKVQFSNNNQYSSKYITFPAAGRPNNDNVQGSFFKIDATIALKDADDRWEVALIGKNLTDKLVASNCSSTNFAGGIVLGNDNYGGVNMATPGLNAETGCFADGPGRSIWVRLTFKPFEGR